MRLADMALSGSLVAFPDLELESAISEGGVHDDDALLQVDAQVPADRSFEAAIAMGYSSRREFQRKRDLPRTSRKRAASWGLGAKAVTLRGSSPMQVRAALIE